MANSFREDSEGVASTVATLFALLAATLFIQAAVISVIPARQYDAEHTTSVQALQALDYIRYAAVGAAVPGGQFSVTIPLGTPSASAFGTASDGSLQFNTGTVAPANISMQYVPTIHDSRITKVDQDVILAIDSSGSMTTNDPGRLRIQAAGDAQARLEAARAKANNITVYTIGLGPGADGALLQEIATTTGGTYYAAPTADSIKFIYLEIANHYSGSVSCGTLVTASSMSGSLTLNRGNRQYPDQTMSLEAGGVTLTQSGGAVIHQGIPFEYTPHEIGTGSFRVSLLTFVGAPFQAAGSDYAFINAQFLYANTNTQTIIRPDLGEQAVEVGNTSAYVQYWAGQGAATPGAAAAVRQPLNQAQGRLQWGAVNASAGKLSLAKFNVDSAQSQLSSAITVTNPQVAAGNMQSWLGKSINDQIFFISCLLTQWVNWYDGITLTIQSPSAAAWALWFKDAFRATGALTTYGISGNTVVLTVNAVDTFIVDERVIQLTNS